jgi:hypothetical protein
MKANALIGILREFKHASLFCALSCAHLAGVESLDRRYCGMGCVIVFHSVVKNIHPQFGALKLSMQRFITYLTWGSKAQIFSMSNILLAC